MFGTAAAGGGFGGKAMADSYRRAMDVAYMICVWIAGAALVLVSAVIPWAVFTRYVLNSAASWPEITAVLLTIVVTFYGAAACYRLGIHMNVAVLTNMLSDGVRRAVGLIVELLMAMVAVFMIIYGIKLCEATWQNSIAEFPWLSVGIVYSPIPVGGLFTLLFVIERVTIGPPPAAGLDPHLPVE